MSVTRGLHESQHLGITGTKPSAFLKEPESGMGLGGTELMSGTMEHTGSIKVEALSVARRESASILFVSVCT